MVNTQIRQVIFFAAKDREALYSQKTKTKTKQNKQTKKNKNKKQDQELTVAQIMNSLLPNSDLN